jgi:hypothetical protein
LYSIVCTAYIFTHSFIDGYPSCCHLLAIANNVAMNIGEQWCTWILVFSSFGYLLRSRIVRSCDKTTFNFLRKFHTVYYSSCAILYLNNKIISTLALVENRKCLSGHLSLGMQSELSLEEERDNLMCYTLSTLFLYREFYNTLKKELLNWVLKLMEAILLRC